ncbi:MAG: universal stress protein [Phycisphaerales bacterium]
MQNIKNIVVGVDYSPCSQNALSQAVRIARATRAQVRAVSVIDTLVAVQTADELTALQQQIVASLLEETRAMWPAFASRAGADSVPLHVEINSPTAAIVRHAKEHHAELVVLGTHGTSPAGKGTGTVASSVVRRCPGKVLLVQDAQQGPFRKVLAAIDFSTTSREAFEQALNTAAMDSASLHVVYAYSPPWEHMKQKTGSPEATQEFRDAYAGALEQRMSAFCDVGRPEGVWAKPVFHAVAHKNHGQGIIDTAKSIGADLVVLGTHGTSNLREILLGSTAERVVRDAHCSILAIHPSK